MKSLCITAVWTILFIGRVITTNAQDYQVPRPNFNISDSNVCKQVLCSHTWKLDKSFLEDSSINSPVYDAGGTELRVPLNGTIDLKHPWFIDFRAAEWTFYSNNTCKITGYYSRYQTNQNQEKILVTKRDTSVYEQWAFRTLSYAIVTSESTLYINENGYDVKVRHFAVCPSIIGGPGVTALFTLVQNGVQMAQWQGQSTFADKMTIIPNPFVYDAATHLIWVQSKAITAGTNVGSNVKPAGKQDTLILTGSAGSPSQGLFLYFKDKNNKQVVGEGKVQSCYVNSVLVQLLVGSEPPLKVDERYLNRKFLVTFSPDSITLPDDNTVDGMDISKMVLIK